MRDRPTLTMSAIVVGTYVIALYGSFGSSVSAKTLTPAKPPPIRQVSSPATRPATSPPMMSDVSLEER